MTTYGMGTVYYSSDKGVWVAAVELPRKRGEPRRRKSFSGPTKEAVEQRLADYRRQHPARASRRNPRHLDRALAPGHHTDTQWWEYVREVGLNCYYCGTETDYRIENAGAPNALQRDHKTPLSRGGSDDLSNIAVSCRTCNMSKGCMTEDEYREWVASNG